MKPRVPQGAQRSRQTVAWATLASAEPMGQQRYESEIQQALTALADPAHWVFKPTVLRSLRSPLAGDRRFPMGLAGVLPASATAVAAPFLYPRADLVHRFDLRLPPANGPEVLTIHDLAPLRFPDEGRLTKSTVAAARRAQVVICPSSFAAAEVKDLLGVARTAVVHSGVRPLCFGAQPLSREELARLGLGPHYIVHAGGATARKNLAALAQAWRQLAAHHRDLWLALCGPFHPDRSRLFQGLERARPVGRLDPPELVVQLMAGARAVVVPSIYEGFGFPALEGMACGTPVVAARAGALPEVCQSAAELVPPDADSLAAGLDRVLSDPNLARRLADAGPVRAAEFSWDAAAARHLEVYARALAK